MKTGDSTTGWHGKLYLVQQIVSGATTQSAHQAKSVGSFTRWRMCIWMMCALGTTVPAGCHGWCPVGTEEVHEGFVSFPEYPDNRKMHSCRLPDGRLNGPYEVFSEDGALETRGHYWEGRKCGTWVSYDGQGNEIDRLNLEPCEPTSCPNPAPGCQDEMVELYGYWIDRYEASRFNATECSAGSDNASGACSQASVLPWSGASWSEARAACEHVGKRLCSLGEWQDACDGHAGAGGRPFPFGEEWSDSACNTWDAQAGIGGILPTGTLPTCKTPSGVFDLVGNVSEYIGSGFVCHREPCGVAAGGSYYSGEAPDWCNAEPLEESLDVDGGLISSGFRCCR